MKTLIVAILLAGVVPLLLGLLFELVIVAPLRVPLDQTPLFYPWQVSCSHPSAAIDPFLYFRLRATQVLVSHCFSASCISHEYVSKQKREDSQSGCKNYLNQTDRSSNLSMRRWTLWDDFRGSLHVSDQTDTKLHTEVSIAMFLYAQMHVFCLSFLESFLPVVMQQEVRFNKEF